MELALNPVAFRLGSLSVKWYGIIMAVAIVVATWMSIDEGKKRHIASDDFVDLLLWAVPIGYVGARLYYVIFEWGYYSQHPDQIIAIWNGGIAVYGGLIAGLIVLLIFCHKRGLPPFLMLAAGEILLIKKLMVGPLLYIFYKVYIYQNLLSRK